MSNINRLMFLCGLFVIGAVQNVYGHMNLYLNQHEVMRLLGLSAELYYVRDGLINEYALHFTVPVPANLRDITFTWQSLAGRPLPYSVNIVTSDPSVLPQPKLNISNSGTIPTEIETFSIDLLCSGLALAEVDVTINIKITLNKAENNVTELIFRRKKICYIEPTERSTNDLDDPLLLEAMSAAAPAGLLTLIIGSILALLLVIVLISIAYCARSPTKRTSQPLRTSSFQRLQTHPSAAPPLLVFPSAPSSTLPRSERFDSRNTYMTDILREPPTIKRYLVRLSVLLQEGTFGRVYRGTYNECQDVLVKTIAQHANGHQVELMLQEGMSLYAASHPSILSLLGVSIDDQTTPFMLYVATPGTRNLKIFLQEPASRALTTIQIMVMSMQIVQALAHLHSHGVVHRDVAARNCVIDEQLQVKLTDNSLARDLFPEDYGCLGDSENRPIKWLALETLQKKMFSEASDTWSFGVLMWELCNLARQPYQEIVNEDMEHYLMGGIRLVQPINCPDELFSIMAYCWSLSPMERPSFGQLQVQLQEFHSQITRYI